MVRKRIRHAAPAYFFRADQATSQISGLVIDNNQIAGAAPEIWLAGRGVMGALVRKNRMGLAFDGSGLLPSNVTEENLHWGLRLDSASGTTVTR